MPCLTLLIKLMCLPDCSMQESHTWLPRGWVIEVRAGGKKMDKMYKVGWRFVAQ